MYKPLIYFGLPDAAYHFFTEIAEKTHAAIVYCDRLYLWYRIVKDQTLTLVSPKGESWELPAAMDCSVAELLESHHARLPTAHYAGLYSAETNKLRVFNLSDLPEDLRSYRQLTGSHQQKSLACFMQWVETFNEHYQRCA